MEPGIYRAIIKEGDTETEKGAWFTSPEGNLITDISAFEDKRDWCWLINLGGPNNAEHEGDFSARPDPTLESE